MSTSAEPPLTWDPREEPTSTKDGDPVKPAKDQQKPAPTPPPMFKCGSPYRYMPKKKEGVDYWEKILEPVQKKDMAQCDAWRDEVQFILIFAGLFSAVVTTFLVESYKNLRPDANEAAVVLLARIAERLDNPINASETIPALGYNPLPFTPEFSSIRVNIFWFLSLVLSLTTVIVGIVSLQWLREHQSYPEYFSAEDKFMLLHMRTEMLEKWHVSAFFTALPFLLQVALVLFFIGLADFLASLGVTTLTIPVTVLITAPMLFLLATTAIPTLQCYTVTSPRTQIDTNIPIPCPYKSPQAHLFRLAFSTSPGAQLFRHALFPIYSIFVRSFKFVRTLWRKNGTNLRELHPYISTNFVGAPKWADLDLEWVSVRQFYSFQLLNESGPMHLPGNRDKDWAFGPLYDHVQGILRVCRQYAFDHDMLESALHCFAHTIPPYQATLEPTPSLAPSAFKRRIADHELKPSYKSLVKMLKQDSLPITSDVLASPGVELLYDEVLLLFLQRLGGVWYNSRMELYFRVRDYFYVHHAVPSRKVDEKFAPFSFNIEWCESIGYHRHALYFSPKERGYLDKRDAEFMESFIKEIAKGKLNWTLYQLFDHYGVRRLVSQYVRNSPSRHPPLLLAVNSLKSALWQCLNTDDTSDPEIELKAIQSLFVASALVFVDVYYSKKVTTPQEIINLGVVLFQFCERALSNKPIRDHILKLGILDRIPVPMEWPRSPSGLEVNGLNSTEKKLVTLLEVVRAHTSEKFPARLFRETANNNDQTPFTLQEVVGTAHIQHLLRDLPGIEDILGATAAHRPEEESSPAEGPNPTEGRPIRSPVISTSTPVQPSLPLNHPQSNAGDTRPHDAVPLHPGRRPEPNPMATRKYEVAAEEIQGDDADFYATDTPPVLESTPHTNLWTWGADDDEKRPIKGEKGKEVDILPDEFFKETKAAEGNELKGPLIPDELANQPTPSSGSSVEAGQEVQEGQEEQRWDFLNPDADKLV